MLDFLKKNKKKSEKNVQTVLFKLSGLHCPSCSLNIDNTLEDLPGVLSSEASYAKLTVKVEFNPQQIDENKIKNAITELGYQASF